LGEEPEKIEWAVSKFNVQFADMVSAGMTPVEAVDENVGLLFYVRKIHPTKDFPASARDKLTAEAKAAVEEWETEQNQQVL